MNGQSLTRRLDGFAVGLSVVCAIHCLAVPVLAVLLPVAGGFLTHEHFHAILLIFVLPTSLLSLFLGCRRHGNSRVWYFGIVGIAIMAGAVLAHDVIGDGWERFATVVGGSLLAVGHILNYRGCRKLGCEH